MKLTRVAHLDGDAGVAQTIEWMRRLIRQGKQDPDVHELASRILTRARVPAFDWAGEAKALFDAFQKNMRFTRDVHGNETLHAAPDLIRLKTGDCDDFTILMLSLAQSIGFPGRIVTIATDAPWLGSSASIDLQAPEFCHVYPEVEIDGRWVALDCARQHPAFGKSPERFTRKRVWSLDSQEYTDMAGPRMSIAPRQGPAGAWRADVYLPFRVAASSGSYLNGFPVPPPAQRFKRPPIGLGNYGVPAARKVLGDDSSGDGSGIDWSGVAQAVTAGTTGAANIITAERASPYNLVPTTSPQGRSNLPATSLLSPAYGSPFGGISTDTLLIGALLLGGVALASRR